VFAGQCRLIELGYRQGGPAGYGLRRILVDQNGSVKSELARGEHKSLQTDRVILMPGPDDEWRRGEQVMLRAKLNSTKPSDVFKAARYEGPRHAYQTLVDTQEREGLYAMPCAAKR
jgi:hypothetical protein